MIILSILFVLMCLGVFALGITLVYNRCIVLGFAVLSLASLLSGMVTFIIASTL